MRKRWLDARRGGALALALALSLGLAGCDQPGQSQANPQQKSAPTPPGVAVSKPIQREIVEWDEYTGRFDAVETVEVRARVSGYLDATRFKDGQIVKQGDLLYVIDRRPFERALDQAQAELVAATTKVANANLDVERGKPLVERRVMSEKSFDDRANLLREAQAAVKVSEAKVKTAELELSFTRMTSPLTGRISRSLVSNGNWVSAGGTANATLLTSIVSQDPIHIYFDVNENNYIKYKRLAERGVTAGAANVGAPVEVALPDERGFPHKGRLDFLDNRLDQGTGTCGRGPCCQQDNLFSPGLFARVRLQGSPEYMAVMLPDEAVGTDQANRFVYIVGTDDIPARRLVELGPLVDGLRVIRKGITDQDWVVIRGQQRVRADQKIAPKRIPLKVSDAEDNHTSSVKKP
jgi:RND family efflux transporter MFP subunit